VWCTWPRVDVQCAYIYFCCCGHIGRVVERARQTRVDTRVELPIRLRCWFCCDCCCCCIEMQKLLLCNIFVCVCTEAAVIYWGATPIPAEVGFPRYDDNFGYQQTGSTCWLSENALWTGNMQCFLNEFCCTQLTVVVNFKFCCRFKLYMEYKHMQEKGNVEKCGNILKHTLKIK